MNPAPKIALTRFGAGVHSFWKAEKDLPVGIVPSVSERGMTQSWAGTWSDSLQSLRHVCASSAHMTMRP
jgi:hypothetical protein